MSGRRSNVSLGLVLGVLVGLAAGVFDGVGGGTHPAGCALAEDVDALDLVDDADKALAAGKPAAAETLYRRAIEKAAGCLPARRGLGDALLAQEKVQEAIVAFRQVLRDAAADPAMPSAWAAHVTAAQRQLTERDAHGRELEQAVDEHVKVLLRLVTRHKASDPELADRMLDTILTLRPTHEKALEMRGRMAAAGARKEALFDGKQIADWDGGRSKWWSVVDGVIVARTKGLATYIRTQKQLEGEFDVLMEARITQRGGDVPFIALLGAWKAEFNHTRFGVLGDAVMWFEHHEEGKKDQVYREDLERLKKPFDPAQWNVYELRFRKEHIQALVNGEKLHEIPRTEMRDRGYVGILAQDCDAEIRRVEVLYR